MNNCVFCEKIDAGDYEESWGWHCDVHGPQSSDSRTQVIRSRLAPPGCFYRAQVK